MNCLNFELVSKKAGNTKIKTAIKNITGINSFNPIISYSKNFLLSEKIF
tara:strand:+ start:570 stop:716 length:147 start_codon:yes stop_codon:yes gene_type:complete